MRKTLMFSAVALVLGFIIGIICNSAFLGGSRLRGTVNAALISPPPAPISSAVTRAAAVEMDTSDNIPLRGRADQVLTALKSADYATLAALVHPEYGVIFTPYSTVRPDTDLRFLPDQVAGLASDATRYLWGSEDGSGVPIRMTIPDYLARYVYNADFLQAPMIAVDRVIEKGNALENVMDEFTGCRFVEYHFPGLDPGNKGFDWCSLKLVFAPYEGDWRLVGLIHSEWTI